MKAKSKTGIHHAAARQRKIAPPPDAAGLRAAALRYLARYAASSGRLRRVLTARLARAARDHADFAADPEQRAILLQAIEIIIADCIDRKYIDDAAFAATKARHLRQAGASRRGLAAKLRTKGLTAAQVATVLTEEADEEGEQAEYRAALRLAQRKKLGAFRPGPPDAIQKRRDLAALARAGFSHDVARRALNNAE
ncbi:MAG: RecX family transcriptional regulator [Alphaproteobacteria bacterium]